MKALAVFLSVYILMLGGIPCPDICVPGSPHQAVCAQNQDSPSSHDFDHCSPFCTCQCCQASCCLSGPPDLQVSAERSFHYQEFYPELTNPDLSGYTLPPKA